MQCDLSASYAQGLDRDDPLRSFGQRFYKPPGTIYMDGNSLGLLSRDAERTLLERLEEWKSLGIGGWLEADPPWFYLGEQLGRLQAPLMGAEPEELVATSSTTVNLHALLAGFYRPEGARRRLVGDSLNFPSDAYALQSQVRLHGLDCAQDLVLVESRDGRTLEEEDIVAAMSEEVAVIVLPSVLYRSGQLLDMGLLTREAHARGCLIGFDCSHSAGALPHRLDDWGVDFAFWCTYKYLNSGPGGIATLYVNRRHFDRLPGLAGWWGCDKARQFDMSLEFTPAASAGSWQVGTISLFSAAPLLGSLALFAEAGTEHVRQKSLDMTEYLIRLVDQELSDAPYHYRVGSPRDGRRRGGHVAVEHDDALRVCAALRARGVVPDFRPPNVVRLAPIALYNTFEEVWQTVQHLKAVIDLGEVENFSRERGAVS